VNSKNYIYAGFFSHTHSTNLCGLLEYVYAILWEYVLAFSFYNSSGQFLSPRGVIIFESCS